MIPYGTDSQNSLIYIDDYPFWLTQDFSISIDKDTETRRRPNSLNGTDHLNKEGQTSELSLGWIAGSIASDPMDFYDSGFYTTQSKTIKKVDELGTQTFQNGFLTSYEVSMGVGEAVIGSASLAASPAVYETGVFQVETFPSVNIFRPSQISVQTSFSEATGLESGFPIQKANFSLDISRRNIIRHGSFDVSNRIPEGGKQNELSFSVLKNAVQEIDFSEIVLSTGDISIVASGCEASISYLLQDCVFKGISESSTLNENDSYDLSFLFADAQFSRVTVPLVWDDSEIWDDSEFWIE